MKILVVQDHLRSGGTERQSVLLANAFATAGHPTTLLTFRPGGALAATILPNVKREVLQPFNTGLDWFAPGLNRVAAMHSPDVILCMGRMANCHAGSLQRQLPGTAVIATMRTGKKLPWLFRRSLRLARHVVANSRESQDTLCRQYGIVRDKISVIHNSLVFPPEAALVRNNAFRSKEGAGPETIVLLCVAMFRPEKNQQELIEIAATLPAKLDWQLWLAGDGPARATCEHLVARKKLGSRVKFPGFLRDPSPLYAAADVAVHASSSESLSNFLIEAQAHGLPAVAYQAQGIRESFVPDQTGWEIRRGDRAAFHAAVMRLAAASSNERLARATAARHFARSTFDPGRQVAAYLALFQQLKNNTR